MARILIIDDDQQVQELFSRVLSHAGHEVRVANNGRDGLKTQREDPADLLICDLVMPEMDGLELMRELRRDRATTPIVAITGSSHVAAQQNLEMASYLGATRILTKPFGLSQLVDTVAELLAGAEDPAAVDE